MIASRSPADCFDVAREAWRIATRYMTPVMILSDGYIANGAEPWLLPDVSKLERIVVEHPAGNGTADHPFLPYARDERLSRPWAIPGTPGLMHRIGGLEKQDITGNVSYDPVNHEHMVNLRAAKIAGIAADIPPQEVTGPQEGRLLVLSWGGTVRRLRHRGPQPGTRRRVGRSRPPALSQPAAGELGRDSQALRARADPGVEPGATAAIDSRRIFGPRGGAEQDPRQAVHDSRDYGQDSRAARREARGGLRRDSATFYPY